jgi:hypothetical protein
MITIFKTVSASDNVKAFLGKNPVRFFPFGQSATTTNTYSTYQIIAGNPENYITGAPDIDRYLVQIDVYAHQAADAQSAALAIRDAIEPRAHIVSWRGNSRDDATQRYRCSFDVSWFESRG